MILDQSTQQILMSATWKAQAYGIDPADLLVLQRHVEGIVQDSSEESESEDVHLLAKLCAALIDQIRR